MAVFRAPIPPGYQWETNNGLPLAEGTLTTYLSGTSTPATTYTSETGLVPNANPLTLDAAGRVPSNVDVFLSGGTVYRWLVQDAAGNTIADLGGIRGVGDPGSLATEQWVAGPVATWVSSDAGSTVFTAEGDQRPLFQVGRRVRITDVGGEHTGTITVSSYAVGPNRTTVTVVVDGGTVIANPIAAVAYSLLSAEDDAIPRPGGPGDVGTLQTDVGTLQTDVGALQTDVGALQTPPTTVLITASGNYSPPTGCTHVKVFAQAGGQSGAKGPDTQLSGGGGGAGGWGETDLIPVGELGAPVVVTIGAGGAVVSPSDTDGNAGQATSFGALLTVPAAATVATATGVGGAGGGIGAGTKFLRGGTGGAGAPRGVLAGETAKGGDSVSGGGRYRGTGAVEGSGAGGHGVVSSGTGIKGANGVVIVTEYYGLV